MRLAKTLFLRSSMLLKAAGSRLCGAASTAQHHLYRPIAVAGLSCRPFVTALSHQAPVAAHAWPVSSSAALQRAHLQQRRQLFTTSAAYSGAPAVDSASEGLAGDGQQADYDPSIYDHQYVNYVSLTGTVQSLYTDAGACSFQMLLNRNPDPAAGGAPVFDAVRVYMAPAIAAEAAAKLQEGKMFNVVARLVHDVQGNLMVSAEEVHLISNPPPEDLVSSTIYQPPSQQQQQQYGQQRQYGQPRQSSAVAAGFPALIPDVPGMPQYSDDPVEARWIDLFRNPGNYFDNRDKKQGRQPDFNSKAKDNQNRRSGLWIDSNNTPQWVLSYLMPGGCSNNSSGSSSYGSSSYNSYSSQGVVGGGGDAYMPQQASSQKEAEWMDVCRNYANYWDNRINKRNPRAPDFVQRGRTGQEVALWISSKDTPEWVLPYINSQLPPPPPPRAPANNY